jgi:fluoroacetyl-CoA thioesterase
LNPEITTGLCNRFSLEVTSAMQAQFGDTLIHSLYSTAAMINHMEWVSYQLIEPFLERNETAVGYQVEVKHLRPTAVGKTVHLESTIVEIENNRIRCKLTAWGDEQQKIGEGFLVQVILPRQVLWDKVIGETLESCSLNVQKAAMQGALLSSDRFPEEISGQSACLPLVDRTTGQLIWLRLHLLGWAGNSVGCTRYDEWMHARIECIVFDRDDQVVTAPCVEGMFLLRYELDDWYEQLQQLCSGQVTTLKTAFLEMPLEATCTWHSHADVESWTFLGLIRPDSSNHEVTRLSQPFVVDAVFQKESLSGFCEALKQLMDAFPSRL